MMRSMKKTAVGLMSRGIDVLFACLSTTQFYSFSHASGVLETNHRHEHSFPSRAVVDAEHHYRNTHCPAGLGAAQSST